HRGPRGGAAGDGARTGGAGGRRARRRAEQAPRGLGGLSAAPRLGELPEASAGARRHRGQARRGPPVLQPDRLPLQHRAADVPGGAGRAAVRLPRARVLRDRRARARARELRSGMTLKEQIRANRWRTLWLLFLFAVLVGVVGLILGYAFEPSL